MQKITHTTYTEWMMLGFVLVFPSTLLWRVCIPRIADGEIPG